MISDRHATLGAKSKEVFAAQAASAPHLVSAAAAASADPYNVTNLHNFQTSQVLYFNFLLNLFSLLFVFK